MSSPVDKSDFPELTTQTTVCARLSQLLGINTLLNQWFDWFIGDDGEISDEAVDSIADRLTPIGTIILYCSSTAPTEQWLACDGRELVRTEFPELWNRMQSTFGGNGTTTFRLPDLRDKVPLGSGGKWALGDETGTEEVTLTVPQMPIHSHVTTLEKVSEKDFGGWLTFANGDGGSVHEFHDFPSQPQGGGAAHPNMQPSMAIAYYVKAL